MQQSNLTNCLCPQMSKMSSASVELFFDVVSPYTYLAFELLLRVQPSWEFKLILTPAFLGGVMQASGNKPPATVPNKAKYLFKDIIRNSKQFNIQMIPQPKKFPIMTLNCMRCLIWIQEAHPDKLIPAARAFWEQYWGRGDDISTPEAIQEIMNKVLPEDKESWKEAVQSPEIKEKLLKNTQRAIDSGAFGFPWMLVKSSEEAKPQVLFGSDRFSHLAIMLGKEWTELPALPPKKSAL
jgi:glutathione S-transferase kappa 1